ncbi:hypothetical protein ACE1SV_44880 [Streptomyces sennicomposti]
MSAAATRRAGDAAGGAVRGAGPAESGPAPAGGAAPAAAGAPAPRAAHRAAAVRARGAHHPAGRRGGRRTGMADSSVGAGAVRGGPRTGRTPSFHTPGPPETGLWCVRATRDAVRTGRGAARMG